MTTTGVTPHLPCAMATLRLLAQVAVQVIAFERITGRPQIGQGGRAGAVMT